MNWESITLDQLSFWSQWLSAWAQIYVPRVLSSLVVLFLGIWFVRRVVRLATSGFEKAKVDPTVSKFLTSLLSIGLKIILLLTVAGMFGVKTTSFIAILGAAGLAIGLSLQGSLSNFAGGVIILLFKPYRVGDLVDLQGVKGHVIEINVLTTTILTLDQNHVFVPNGPIINANILNYSKKNIMRVDVQVGIAYQESIDQAREVLLAMAFSQPGILSDPAPKVYVNSLGDSSVNLLIRVYTPTEAYWETYFAVTEGAKKALDAAQIQIPFPQRVVHTVK